MEKTIYLAGGCFWGAQHYLKQINGVLETETGFANGKTSEADRTKASDIITEHPAYEEVYTDRTGYAEAVRVVYDDDVLPLSKLLKLYFLSIEPTSVNRQGEDYGTRYRTGIYYIDPADYGTIADVYREEQAGYSSPLAVEVEPIKCFFAADESHQDYLDKHPDGYCHLPEALFEMARQANRRNVR